MVQKSQTTTFWMYKTLVIYGKNWWPQKKSEPSNSMSVPVFFREISWHILDPYDWSEYVSWSCIMISLNDVLTKHYGLNFITWFTKGCRSWDSISMWRQYLQSYRMSLKMRHPPKDPSKISVYTFSQWNWWDFLVEDLFENLRKNWNVSLGHRDVIYESKQTWTTISCTSKNLRKFSGVWGKLSMFSIVFLYRRFRKWWVSPPNHPF